MPALVLGVEAGERVAISPFTASTALQHALAAIALAAVAQLNRLVRAGRGARGHGGAAQGAVLEHDVDLDGRVAAAVENFAADDGGNGGHGSIPGCVEGKRTLAPS